MKWLDDLKPGDKVIVYSHYNRTIEIVERLTKTQIILKGVLTKYRRCSGYQVGNAVWDQSFLRKANDEECEKILYDKKYLELYHKIFDHFKSNKKRKITLNQLERIDEILNEKMEKPK